MLSLLCLIRLIIIPLGVIPHPAPLLSFSLIGKAKIDLKSEEIKNEVLLGLIWRIANFSAKFVELTYIKYSVK